jgi:hypothetical protein
MLKVGFCSAILFFVSPTVFASNPLGLHGEVNLSSWAGKYEVTQCTQCPDVNTNGTILKNFASLSIGNWAIPANEKLACSDVDTTIGFSIETASNDKTIQNWDDRGSGQCDWSFDEYLNVTPDSYEYRSYGQNPGGYTITLTVQKQSDGTYVIDYQSSTTETPPAFGLPQSYEMKAIAKKVIQP